MRDDSLRHVRAAVDHAEKADKASVVEGVSSHFLEILKTEHDEILVRGNQPGLVHFGLSILKLALENEGAHRHFDEAGILDRCEMSLIVAKCKAEWEA